MKTILYLVILAIIAGCHSGKPGWIKSGLEGNPMPAIELLSLDSITYINTELIKPGKSTILFSFEPWCPYCRAQTKAMLSQINKLNGMNIWMLSTSRFEEFKMFCRKYELQKYPNIYAGIDYKYTFSGYFKNRTIPFLAIYGPDKKLKHVLKGKHYISTIKEAALN